MLDYSEHYGTLWGPVIDVGGGQVCVWEVRCLADNPTRCLGRPLQPMGVAVHEGVTRGKGRTENKGRISIIFFVCVCYANLTRQEDK